MPLLIFSPLTISLMRDAADTARLMPPLLLPLLLAYFCDILLLAPRALAAAYA